MSRMSFEAESSSRSAWNARAAVVRCSGARVFLTPSHVKASLTAAMVVRSLLAALGVVWVTGVLVGWVAVRLTVCWPVGAQWWLLWALVRGISLKIGWKARPPRLLADRWRHRLGKSLWLVKILEAYGGRSATEATVEPTVTVSRNQSP